MEVSILGHVRLRMQDEVHLRTVKMRGLLGFLSYKANELVHVDRITEALWDGDAPPDPGKALQSPASRLRRVFREENCPAELTHEHRSYRLDIDQSIVDFHRFQAMMREGHRARGGGDLRVAADLFAAALELWSGPLLADLDTQWARRQRESLTNSRLIPAYCALFDTSLLLGDLDSVLNGLPALLSDHPHDESLAIRWVRALTDANRADEVPVFFREFASRLADDLDAPPSADLVQAVRDATARRPARTARKPALPRDVPYFTGRDDLLDQLDTRLAAGDTGVVALDGLPGIGKTALVKHWARSRRAQFPDGVLHDDLAGYSTGPPAEPHTVMGRFLAQLGVDPAGVPDSTDARATLLRRLLATRAVLVCLDNVRDSSHVRPLLEATSPCPALITSRQRLTGITYRDGVQSLSVPALATSEATELLAKRIGSRASEDPAAFATLVDLCRGLPLALRIVGEHVAMRPAAPIGELADELRHTQRLLDAGAHGDDHTTTLRSTFSLSYRALRDEERRLFRLLGLHPGTRFSVRAADALAGTGDTERVLDALVGAHLVDQEGAGRYHAHDLLHAFAADAAREDEPAEQRARAFRRLLDWYLRSARQAGMRLSADDQHVPELVPEEPVEALTFDNGGDALRWLLTERQNLVASTYRAAELGHHEHVWRFAGVLNVLNRHEDPQNLLEINELGRRSAELTGHRDAVGGCLNNMGTIHARRGEDAAAGRCFELAHKAFTEAGDRRGVAVTTHNMGVVHLKLGHLTEAITWLDEALAMSLRDGSEWQVANTHRRLGDAYRKLDRLPEARSHYRRSLYFSQAHDDLAGQAASMSRLAALNLDEGLLDEAVQYGQAAVDMFDRVLVDRDGTAAALCVLATAHLRHGTHRTAISMAREAVRTYQETKNASGEADALILLGRALSASGEPAAAATMWSAAAELISAPADPRADVIRDLLAGADEQSLPAPRTEGSLGGGPVVNELPSDVG
ncbi:AfsR/SARP family transcriptional regulator [Actinophytocola sp.]|uniref:AfsR/SARP family transcriptional regulator n=1 Tax=Actinophytocola sp. TaxID=1872138 RepID=UPI002ED3A27E